MRTYQTTAFVIAALGFAFAPAARAAVMDDFSDNNDTANPAWTHLSGYVGSTGQAWTVADGQYRFAAPNNGVEDLGFIGSYVPSESFSDVVVTADITSFQDDFVAQGGPFGVLARVNGLNGVGELAGYGYAYEPYAASGVGEMVLYRINQGIDVDDMGAQAVVLSPDKDYRIILEIIGEQLHGQVIDLETGEVVAERMATDATYATGYSGLFAYSQVPVPPTDVAWDNFSAVAIPEPGAGLVILAAGASLLSRRARRLR